MTALENLTKIIFNSEDYEKLDCTLETLMEIIKIIMEHRNENVEIEPEFKTLKEANDYYLKAGITI